MSLSSKLVQPLSLLVLWRLISVFAVQTFHVPDEYWQSLEVAHNLAFGYGHLTWEWRAKIRSYIYPFFISLIYRILRVLRIDCTILLVALPRLCQAALAGYADYRFWVWTGSKRALFAMCTNWFWYYCASRTLTNSLETSLTTVALSLFPWRRESPRDGRFLWPVGLLVAVRPTAAILWTPLCLYHVFTSVDTRAAVKNYVFVGICTGVYSVVVDSLCYGSPVITQWEFFRVNVLDGVADFYGTHHALWYVAVGLPVVLGLQVFPFLVGVCAALKNPGENRQRIVMILVVGWTIGVYSSLSHKEFRFLLPLLPMLLHVSNGLPATFRTNESRRKILLSVYVLSNLLPGLYLGLIHQRGTLDVMKILENELRRSDVHRNDVLFLTPCHATPLYSHLHIDAPIRFLTCEPNLEKLPDYRDEADEFFANPGFWLDENFANDNIPLPEFLIIFDNLTTKITPFLKPYRLLAKIFHSHFPQSNYGEYVMLYRRKL